MLHHAYQQHIKVVTTEVAAEVEDSVCRAHQEIRDLHPKKQSTFLSAEMASVLEPPDNTEVAVVCVFLYVIQIFRFIPLIVTPIWFVIFSAHFLE